MIYTKKKQQAHTTTYRPPISNACCL